MGYRSLKLAGDGIRIILLLISFFACATFLLWQFSENLVDKFDSQTVKTYQKYNQERLHHAVTTASLKPEEGVFLLRQLLDDLSEIHKLDRLDRTKRKAYESIIEILYAMDRVDEALSWAEFWVKFDDKDLFAQIWRAKLMRKSKTRFEDGWLLINEWYQKVPYSSLVSSEYAEYLIAQYGKTEVDLVAI